MSVSPNKRNDERSRGSSNPVTLIAAFAGMAIVAGGVGAAIAMPAVGGVAAVANTAIESFESYPSALQVPNLKQRSIIRDSEGTKLAYLYEQNRVVVPAVAISEKMKDAIIAIEDSRFYEHNGVDVRGTARALATNSQSGEIQQGGSTITQQYVKMVLLESAKDKKTQAAATERSAERKIREARFAIALEKQKSKEEILTNYLNIAYFGSGAYGVQAAAETYFNKPASKLNVVEAATLAGIVQQPGAFDPIRNPKDSMARRNVVLDRMAELGKLTPAQLKKAKAAKPKNYVNHRKFPNGCTYSKSPYFCDFVLNTIRNDTTFGATKAKRTALLTQGGLDITTTLDPGDQRSSFNAVRRYIPVGDSSWKAAAISMVQPGTGKILAMSQNTNWGTKKGVPGITAFNYNVRKKDGGVIGMQAGSIFKVFTLAAALEKGISPYVNINAPGTSTFYGFRDCDGYQFPPYTVSNAGKGDAGTLNMYSGTKGSVNTFFIGLERMVSLCRQAQIAESMGVRTGSGKKLPRIPSFPLGSIEVVPLDMAGAYAGIANDGVWCKPNPVRRITSLDRQAKVYGFTPNCRRVLSSRVADTLVALMKGPVSAGGTAPGANFGRSIAGKTGTTDNSSAVWFSGYSPQIAASVWVGDPRGGFRHPVKNIYINGRYYGDVFGATIPAPIWRNAMAGAHQDLPPKGFGSEPKYINFQFKTDARQKKEEKEEKEETGDSGNAQLPNLSGGSTGPKPTPIPGGGESNELLEDLRDLDFGF